MVNADSPIFLGFGHRKLVLVLF
uniref:Uncharacterized protein n=1 Tax=Rhizophora mucronata TaxID=61149 RepID=A0A2P2PM26_RHIMU